jgi:hypothetical protein
MFFTLKTQRFITNNFTGIAASKITKHFYFPTENSFKNLEKNWEKVRLSHNENKLFIFLPKFLNEAHQRPIKSARFEYGLAAGGTQVQ